MDANSVAFPSVWEWLWSWIKDKAFAKIQWQGSYIAVIHSGAMSRFKANGAL